METRNNTLVLGGISVEALMQEYGSPLYVYEEETLRTQYRKLQESFSQILLKSTMP